MPLETRMSAVARTSASVTLVAKWFQLFQPMGGVAASGGDCALNGAVTTSQRKMETVTAKRRRVVPRRINREAPCPPENDTFVGRGNLAVGGEASINFEKLPI